MRGTAWWLLGMMWGAVLKARQVPLVTRSLDQFCACFEAYWMVGIFAFMFGQNALRLSYEAGEPPRVDVQHHENDLANAVVGMRDVALIIIFFFLSLTRSRDPYQLAAPVRTWSLLAFCTHQAVIFTIPCNGYKPTPWGAAQCASGTVPADGDLSRDHWIDKVQAYTLAYCLLSLGLVVYCHKSHLLSRRTNMGWIPHKSRLVGASCLLYLVPLVWGAYPLFGVQAAVSFLSDYVYLLRDSVWHPVDRVFALLLSWIVLFSACFIMPVWHALLLASPVYTSLFCSMHFVRTENFLGYKISHTMWHLMSAAVLSYTMARVCGATVFAETCVPKWAAGWLHCSCMDQHGPSLPLNASTHAYGAQA